MKPKFMKRMSAFRFRVQQQGKCLTLWLVIRSGVADAPHATAPRPRALDLAREGNAQLPGCLTKLSQSSSSSTKQASLTIPNPPRKPPTSDSASVLEIAIFQRYNSDK